MAEFNYTQFPIPARPLSGVSETSYADAVLVIAPGGVKKIATQSFLDAAGIYPLGFVQCEVDRLTAPQTITGTTAAGMTYTPVPVILQSSENGVGEASSQGLTIEDGEVVIAEAGLYKISGALRMTGVGEGTLYIRKNSATDIANDSVTLDEYNGKTASCIPVIVELEAGDMVGLYASCINSAGYMNPAPTYEQGGIPISPSNILLVERLTSNSGEAPEVDLARLIAEIEDARIGYDGTTYPSLGDAIRSQVEEAMSSGGDGLTEEIKQALLDCFNHIAIWTDGNAREHIEALENALYPAPPAALTSISAVFDQTDKAVSVDLEERVNAYINESGQWLAASDSTSFIIPVTPGDIYSMEWTNTTAAAVSIYFRWGFSDSNTPTGQTLSGWRRTSPQDTPTAKVVATGEFLILQIAGSKAETIFSNNYFTITKKPTIYENNSLDDLKQYLLVTANYDDGTSSEVTTYTLSGTLEAGTSVITVTYKEKSTTFNVVVTESRVPASYVEAEYIANETAGTRLATGVTASSGEIIIDAKTMRTGSNAEMYFAGGGTGSTSAFGVGYSPTGTNMLAYSNASSIVSASADLVNKIVEAHAVFTSVSPYRSIQITVDGTTYDGSVPTQANKTIAGSTLSLFGMAPTGTNNSFIGRIYECIVRDNGTAVLNAIPCVRKSDGVVGFFDLVGEAFLTTANIIAGPVL